MFNTHRPFVSLALRFYLQNHCAKSGTLGLGRTNSGSVNEPLMGGSFFCGERGGDRSIGEANLRKGAALQWLAHLAPVRGVSPFYGSGAVALFYGSGPAAPFNGSGTAAPSMEAALPSPSMEAVLPPPSMEAALSLSSMAAVLPSPSMETIPPHVSMEARHSPAHILLYEMNLSDIILTPRYLSKSLSLSGRKAVM